MLFFQKADGPVECSSTGRVKRKGRQDISYKVFFSDSINEDEVQDYCSRQSNRFELSSQFFPLKSIVAFLVQSALLGWYWGLPAAKVQINLISLEALVHDAG